MKTITIAVHTPGAGIALHQISAHETPVPGLVIHPAINSVSGPEPGFVILHETSGWAVAWWPHADPEAVLAAALDLAQLTDWTLPADDLDVTAEQVQQAVTRWSGDIRWSGELLPYYGPATTGGTA